MKKIILSTSFLVSAMLLMAQTDPDMKSMFLIRPSFNVSNILVQNNNTKTKADKRIGYGIGIEYVKPLTKMFYAAVALNLNSFGYKKVRTNYLHIPVTVNYLSRSQKVTIGFGPYYGIAIGGSYKNTNDKWTKLNFGEGSSDNRSATDIGIITNFGFKLMGVLINTHIYTGLKDVTPGDRQVSNNFIKVRSWVISIPVPLNEIIKK